jgi:elongation factor G
MDFIAKYGSSPADRANVTAVDGYGREAEVALTSSEPVA